MKNLPPPLTLELLERFVQGQLDAAQSGLVLQMGLQYPEVAAAVDQLKRIAVDKVIADAKAMDPQAFIASGNLEAYLQGSLTESEQQFVELMAQLHPEITAEMEALQIVNALLVEEANQGVKAPERSKTRLLNFIDAEEKAAKTANGTPPPYLNSQSSSTDYDPWVKRDGIAPPDSFDNVFVQPLDANPECLTLLVWVKKEIAGEVHLDAVEKFLVLEGTCMIDVEGEQFALKAGDYMSIPKFREHTVYVTSSTPCKLIVQQIAA
ncbi:MAG TPA: cupin domain-containing protein [Bacteroidia bacterium]|nr:cupin domain-containing protein [Bacteroidia bacterium]